MSSTRRLRKDAIEFLEVKEELILPRRVLPQGIDVLKVMLGRRNKEKELNIELPVMCELKPGTFDPKCSTKDGCRVQSDPTKWCVVSQILERYERAAIPYRKPDKIKKNCQELFKFYWEDIRKHKEYTGVKIVEKREKFIKEKLQALFPAYNVEAEKIINEDKKRSKEKQDEDIAFLHDQMSVRDMALDSRDVEFDKQVRLEAEKMKRKKQREETVKKREENEAKRRESMVTVSWDDVELVVPVNNNAAESPEELKDEDFPSDQKEQKTKRFQGQNVFIPPNIMSLIVPETSRLGLTDGQLVGTVAMLLKACGCTRRPRRS